MLTTLAPTTRSVLQVLSKARLLELSRTFSVVVPPAGTKDAQADALVASRSIRFAELLGALGREELKLACRAHALDDSSRSRPDLAKRLIQAHGAEESVPPKSLFTANTIPRYAPHPGDIVRVRHRQWLVEKVTAPPAEGHKTLVRLVCLDDDNQGRATEVIWELELAANVLQPESHGLGDVHRMDPPRYFGAYLHALKWNCVTATDAKLFQAPFRAGIKLMNHQLTPLRKALSLPRANLFIADDVGLGKTIEAGLVAQELLLRQQVEFLLIVCPASVCLQWRDEMQKKFGLHFEVMNRAFIGRRRQERGFGVNPWGTHTRFIVSHPILRRPEYRDPLLQHIGERVTKSLLILDEAHVAAPAGANRYAVDSRITEVVRDIAPRFENRLFLSATPHNGHSNSFSALLELLDPQRFTRGVPPRRQQLEAVMVRRLKEDLRQLGVEQFPKRTLVSHTVGTPESRELELAHKLAEYTALMRPEHGQGALVFINLQKRLLSSVEAFFRTLQAHHRAITERRAKAALQLALDDEDEYGSDDDALDEADAANVEAESRFVSPSSQAKELLDAMLGIASQQRGAADAKVQALVEWIRKNQCPAVRVGGADPKSSKPDRRWSDRRVIVFTEYGDTKRYLRTLLNAAVDGTDEGEGRILEFHGGMSDEQREEVQRAFNSPPGTHPVRILIATDAAREGVNLQGHCADLFHFDVPWNPARIEQRNGRIDRTLQPAPEVCCHYFLYPDRAEDIVVDKLMKKVETIQRELGSISSVLLDRIGDVMSAGIDAQTSAKLDAAENAGFLKKTATEELDSADRDLERTKREIEESGEILNRSREILEFDPVLLRDALEVGIELAGASKLEVFKNAGEGVEAFNLPDLPQSWQATLDSLRPARARNEPFWAFRKKSPLPIVFRPPPKMNSELAHLHLQHPVVQRVLGRFLSQGFSAHDLSRVTVIRTRHDSLTRVIAFGRLSLFGRGATRLHDDLISVAARYIDGKDAELKPFAEEADRKAITLLEQVLAESPSLEAVSAGVQSKLLEAAPAVFSKLWRHIQHEADSAAHDAERKLALRGTEEAEALRGILTAQREGIAAEIAKRSQLSFADLALDKREHEQWNKEKQYMNERLVAIEGELEREPKQLEALYEVALRRLEPVGLVFLWPETRG